MTEGKKRGRPKRQAKPIGEPLPCFDCGGQGTYYTNVYGIIDGNWRCDGCHQKHCTREIRGDFNTRYGQQYIWKR